MQVDRAERAVVGELEDVIAVDRGRELEQGAAVAHPQAAEGREHACGGGEEAGVVARVAVEGPGRAFGPARGQDGGGLGDEAGVGVVDAAGAVALVEVAAECERGDQQQEQSGRDPARALGERGSGHALMIAGMADNDPRSAVFAEGVLAGRVALVTGGGTGLGRQTRDRAGAVRGEGGDRGTARRDARSGGGADLAGGRRGHERRCGQRRWSGRVGWTSGLGCGRCARAGGRTAVGRDSDRSARGGWICS